MSVHSFINECVGFPKWTSPRAKKRGESREKYDDTRVARYAKVARGSHLATE